MKRWTPEEEAKLSESFPLEEKPPMLNEGLMLDLTMQFKRTAEAIREKWYELSAKGGYRNVKTRGLPVELTDPGVIRSLAREVKELRKENIKLKRKLGELDTAIGEAQEILKGE